MDVLAVSDRRLPKLSNADFLRRQYGNVKAVVSCGDLDSDYLDFIVSVLNVQLFYVRGNHDHHPQHDELGGINLHRRFVTHHGVSMAGLEGSMRYNNTGIQYTESAMASMVLSMMPLLLFRRMTNKYSVELFVAHSPPRKLNDATDFAHRGFRSFRWLLRWARPRYLIHGHIDLYDQRIERELMFVATTIININPYYALRLGED